MGKNIATVSRKAIFQKLFGASFNVFQVQTPQFSEKFYESPFIAPKDTSYTSRETFFYKSCKWNNRELDYTGIGNSLGLIPIFFEISNFDQLLVWKIFKYKTGTSKAFYSVYIQMCNTNLRICRIFRFWAF